MNERYDEFLRALALVYGGHAAESEHEPSPGQLDFAEAIVAAISLIPSHLGAAMAADELVDRLVEGIARVPGGLDQLVDALVSNGHLKPTVLARLGERRRKGRESSHYGLLRVAQ